MTRAIASPPAVLRALVVDDDPVSRALLARYVGQHDALQLVATCESAVAAVPHLRAGEADVVFLDVEMPEMSGLELVRALDACPAIILVTGKAHYAVEAFAVSVTDYLLKPVQYPRFLQAVERVVRQCRQEQGAQGAACATPGDLAAPSRPRTTQSRAGDGEVRDVLFARIDGRLVRIPLAEVHWVEAKGDYVLLHAPKRRYMVHTTMKTMEERLPPSDFVRVHRSHIVRVDRIVDLEDATIVVDRDVIPVGASYRDTLLSRLNTL
ncbi:MAG: response regulator transcription factor [Gemmatimonadaceae bacterium]|nr:response regulator transcription factor [Gemmatimonadaceae bacterium]